MKVKKFALKRKWSLSLLISVIVLGGAVFAQSNSAERIKSREKKILENVTQIRALEYKSDVDVGIYTKKELEKLLKKDLDEALPPAKDRDYTKAYVKLGIITPDMDLKEIYFKLLASQIQGFYDPRSKKLKLIENASESDETAKEVKEAREALGKFGVSYDDFIMSHELTHAAQDQHYDLLTLPKDNDYNDDLGLAVTSAIEGDACYVMYVFAFGEQITSQMSKFLSPDMYAKAPVSGVPAFFYQQVTFPYTYGFNFVSAVKSKEGWDGVNKLFDDLPASSAQIMHPDKYLEHRDCPQEIKLPDVAGALGSHYRVCLANVMGEFSMGLLMKELKAKRQSAKGWEGDEFEVLEDSESADGKINPDKLVLVWLSTWDNEEDAKAFSGAYQEVLDRKYPKSGAQGNLKSAVERRGKDVLILESVPVDRLDKLRDLIWSKATKKELRKVERLHPKSHKK